MCICNSVCIITFCVFIVSRASLDFIKNVIQNNNVIPLPREYEADSELHVGNEDRCNHN